MTALAVKQPVQLLCDSKGIYGIVGSAVDPRTGKPPKIVLRPDRLLEAETRPAALQMIFGGFQHGMFNRMAEERLRKQIHWELIFRKKLNLAPDEESSWWSADSERQARNRRVYHGLHPSLS
jgi:hypothetical protein